MSTINNLKINSFSNSILEKRNVRPSYSVKDEYEVAFSIIRDINTETSQQIPRSPKDICEEYKKMIKSKNVNF